MQKVYIGLDAQIKQDIEMYKSIEKAIIKWKSEPRENYDTDYYIDVGFLINFVMKDTKGSVSPSSLEKYIKR